MGERAIGILGGGASGLSAAYFLRKKGHRNVTVLEKAPRVGGKAHTIIHEGRSYEMGAIMSGPTYKEVRKLAREFNRKITDFAEGNSHGVEFSPSKNQISDFSFKRRLAYGLAALNYKFLYERFKGSVDRPGFTEINPELHVPFRGWARKHARNPDVLEELLGHFFVSFGYGYLSQVPAAYVLKYYTPKMLFSFVLNRIHMMKDGYEELWKKIALELNVELNFDISSVKRRDSKWIVTSKAGEEKIFDEVIVTLPLDNAPSYIELPPDLTHLFPQIKNQYYTSLLVETDLASGRSGVITENYDTEAKLVSWLYRWPSAGVANFYRLSSTPLKREEILSEFQDLALKHNWNIKRVINAIEWKYFPHFPESVLKTSPYLTIKKYQSVNGLYFAGEIMNFSTVEHSIRFSKNLVEEYF